MVFHLSDQGCKAAYYGAAMQSADLVPAGMREECLFALNDLMLSPHGDMVEQNITNAMQKACESVPKLGLAISEVRHCDLGTLRHTAPKPPTEIPLEI